VLLFRDLGERIWPNQQHGFPEFGFIGPIPISSTSLGQDESDVATVRSLEWKWTESYKERSMHSFAAA
jgi:hypothetical protein